MIYRVYIIDDKMAHIAMITDEEYHQRKDQHIMYGKCIWSRAPLVEKDNSYTYINPCHPSFRPSYKIKDYTIFSDLASEYPEVIT